MYSTIIDPNSNIQYPVASKGGLRILRKFMEQLGGEYVGKGTYKCVFSPPIKCLHESERFGVGDSAEYISAITTYQESKQAEFNETLRAKLDPKHKFTLRLIKTCKLGDLDIKTENIQSFSKCNDIETGNFLKNYKYPFNRYDGTYPEDLRLLISKHGGMDLRNFKKVLASHTSPELMKIIRGLYYNFKPILWGLVRFQKYKYIHCDLKPDNLLYNPTTQTYYIIDFGLMVSFREAFKKDYFISHTTNVSDSTYYYKYWPIDAGVAATYIRRGNSHMRLNRPPPISEGPSLYDDYRNPTNIEKLYRDNLDRRVQFIMKSKKKFDTYSMGITMKEYFFSPEFVKAIRMLSRNNKNSNIVKAVMRLQGPLLKLINDMLEIDPTKRINITTVYRRYVTLVRNFNPNKKKRV